MNCRRFSLLLLLLLTLPGLSTTVQAKEIWRNVARIVAVGDLHGDYEQYLKILHDNKLIDSNLDWQGGKTHLVQLGDIADRGPDSLKIMRHLKRLQKQAKKARGVVHTLIGNHELMNVNEDLRYVHPGEYQILVTQESDKLRADYLSRVFDYLLSDNPTLLETKDEKMRELRDRFPLGYVEHRHLWASKGEVFEWIRKGNSIIKINNALFVHGGLSPHKELLSLKEINKRIRRLLKSGAKPSTDWLAVDDGPLWYRGLVFNSKEVELEPLKRMLAFYEVDYIVVAHTPTRGAIMPRFDGLVIQVDVGIAEHYGKKRANLVIEGAERFAMHRGHIIRFPKDQRELLEYLETASGYDPAPSPLIQTIESIKSKQSQEGSELTRLQGD